MEREAKGENKAEVKVEGWKKDEVKAEKANGTMDRNMKNTPSIKEFEKGNAKLQKLFAKVEEN